MPTSLVFLFALLLSVLMVGDPRLHAWVEVIEAIRHDKPFDLTDCNGR
ncbi:hypothetical protein [Hyphomicrobium sp. CS1BSMeth3]|nr:hypothetical protein [Hyphomicrobium sp. CS1BSMeth3]